MSALEVLRRRREAITAALAIAIILIAAMCVPIFLPGSWASWCGRSVRMHGIEIRGSERFLSHVVSVLDLLRSEAPEDLEMLRTYVTHIVEGDRSGMWADWSTPTLELKGESLYGSCTWSAGAIVHDAFHSKLYHDYVHGHGKPVPPEVWGGRERELQCNAYQLDVLKRIGAPLGEIDYLRALDGTHFDTDGDGKYTFPDYLRQNW